MHALKRHFILINLIGGIAVLGSYLIGFMARPDAAGALWGGVPLGIRPAYTACMLLAAAGYFAFSSFIFFRLNPGEIQVGGRFDFRVFNWLYATILFLYAVWMPLTILAVDRSSLGITWAVRLLLALVGLASLALLWALLKLNPPQASREHRLAVLGCTFFCIQTALLDAVVWVAFFRV